MPASDGARDALQPQDLVLTIAGAHLRRPGQVAWSGGLVEVLEGFGFSAGAARAALARLVNRDLLARTRTGRLAFYALTERAVALLVEGDERIFSFGRAQPATERWTVLWHAMPESLRVERARFASRLRFLGFGSVQDATWVAARDREAEVRRLLHQLGIEAYVSVLVGRLAHDPPPRALVAQAWRMEETAARYEAFIADQRDLLSARGRSRLEPAQAFRRRMLMLHRFRAFPSLDPELPAAIDPLHDLRARVVDCFTTLYAALQASSDDYFRAVVAPPASNT